MRKLYQAEIVLFLYAKSIRDAESKALSLVKPNDFYPVIMGCSNVKFDRIKAVKGRKTNNG